MKLKRNRFLIILCVLFTLTTSMKAFAYNTIGYTWNKKSISYYYTYTGAPFSYGASAWSGLDAGFTYSPTYYDVICEVVYEPKDDWDGVSYIGTNMYIQSAKMYINSGISITWNNSEALKSVVAHEFGHVLGLDENGTTNTLMNFKTWGADSRYGTYKITSPQQDDRNGINSLY